MGGIALEIKKVFEIRNELIADLGIQIAGDVNRRSLPHAGKAVMIAAGEIADNFLRQAEVGSLEHVDQRTGNQQVMSEAFRFFIPDSFRAGAVMAEKNVAELTGKSTLDKRLGKHLIIGYNVQLFSVFQIERGKGVLVLFTESIDHALAILIQIIGQALVRNDQNAGGVLQNWERIDGGGINSEFDQGFLLS